jgi:hypothetical protein
MKPMTGMRELIDLPSVERAIRLLAVGLPAFGLLAGLIAGAARRRVVSGGLAGLGVGLAGPLLWLLWLVYNRITDHYGLDSVKGLLVNLAVFLGVGIVLGVCLAFGRRRWLRPVVKKTS